MCVFCVTGKITFKRSDISALQVQEKHRMIRYIKRKWSQQLMQSKSTTLRGSRNSILWNILGRRTELLAWATISTTMTEQIELHKHKFRFLKMLRKKKKALYFPCSLITWLISGMRNFQRCQQNFKAVRTNWVIHTVCCLFGEGFKIHFGSIRRCPWSGTAGPKGICVRCPQ